MIASPCKPLTATELRVARMVSMGASYERIGEIMAIEAATARAHVGNIADKLPNPDELKPYTLVLLWSAHQRWLEEHDRRHPHAA